MDLMLDIETLGNEPGAVILQLACVEFDPYLEINPDKPDVSFPEKSILNNYISIQSCLDAGLTIQEDTLKYWLRQSEETRNRVFSGTVDIYTALYNLDFYMRRVKSSDYERIWTRGVTFDIPIINAAYKAVFGKNKQPTWTSVFRKVHEVRTIMDYCQLKTESPYHGRHDALIDCFNQIHDVRRCFAKQRSGDYKLQNRTI